MSPDPLVRLLAETAPGLRVESEAGGTAPFAYDASNYRVAPRAVAFPRSPEEVSAALRACRELGVAVTARGGGTSMAGNAVGPGLVLEFARRPALRAWSVAARMRAMSFNGEPA